MRVAVLCALFVVALTLTANTANSPSAKPEDVGLSSERLQRITKMIERRIAAGQLAGAVTIVGRRGKVVHHVSQGVMDRESKVNAAHLGMLVRVKNLLTPEQQAKLRNIRAGVAVARVSDAGADSGERRSDAAP